MTPTERAGAHQCSTCLDGQPYVLCKRKCALRDLVERRGNQARRALENLIGMLDDCDTTAGFVWKRSDRIEFLKLAGMTEREYLDGRRGRKPKVKA